MQIAAIDYWALASALGGTLMIATMIWIVVLDRRASQRTDRNIASLCRLYGPKYKLLAELGKVNWHSGLTFNSATRTRAVPYHCESNMTVVREPRLEPVAILDLRPTQITVGMREVKAKRERWRAEKKGGEFLGKHMIPVILGPKHRHYVIDHHHLARALHDEGVKNVAVT